jgi:copper chaperone CopZ
MMKKLVTIGFALLLMTGLAVAGDAACNGADGGDKADATAPAELSEGQARIELAIKGLTCGSCCKKVEGAVKDMAGIISIEADYEKGIAVVVYEKGKVKPKAVIEAINAKTSFKASMPKEA